MHMPSHVTITDVAPRDGLQNEPGVLPVATRVELIARLARAGVPRIEIGAFVNPTQVPQMAGTAHVCAGLQRLEIGCWRSSRATAPLAPDLQSLASDPQFTALIPNLKGYELALAAGLRHVRLVLAASESLNQANFRRSVAGSLADFAQIAARAQSDGLAFGVAIGASFGCPFEGHVPPGRVLDLARHLVDLGVDEIVLADTTGMAVPTQVYDLCAHMLAETAGVPNLMVTVHFHNTRNTGYANAYAALQAGITSFDASLGGIGGCPFAPRAVGNIATEDLAHMLNGAGVMTGIDLEALIAASDWLSGEMGKDLPALVGKAGPVFREMTRRA